VIPAETELTLAVAADTIALAWAATRYTNYLHGTGTQAALTDVFGPMLALTWAYLAMMRVLIP
jgi:thiaminase